MTKKRKAVISETAPSRQYEDYVNTKQKEQQQTEALEAAMDGEDVIDQEFTINNKTYRSGGMGIGALSAGSLNAESKPLNVPKLYPSSHAADDPVYTSNPVWQEGLPTTGKKLVKERMAGFPGEDPYLGDTYQPTRRATYNKPYRKANYMEPSIVVDDDPDSEVLSEMESAEAKMPADMEMFDVIRNGFKIYRMPERTLIYAIIVDKLGETNVAASIRCFGAVAFGGYARDCSNDAYLVECVQAVRLGTMPFSIRLEVPKCGNWAVEAPIPERVLVKSFSPAQRKVLIELREKFPETRYEIQYLQMLLAT